MQDCSTCKTATPCDNNHIHHVTPASRTIYCTMWQQPHVHPLWTTPPASIALSGCQQLHKMTKAMVCIMACNSSQIYYVATASMWQQQHGHLLWTTPPASIELSGRPQLHNTTQVPVVLVVVSCVKLCDISNVACIMPCNRSQIQHVTTASSITM